jgi:hypothetical protein
MRPIIDVKYPFGITQIERQAGGCFAVYSCEILEASASEIHLNIELVMSSSLVNGSVYELSTRYYDGGFVSIGNDTQGRLSFASNGTDSTKVRWECGWCGYWSC